MTVMSDSWIIEQNARPLYKCFAGTGEFNGTYIREVKPSDARYIANWDNEKKQCKMIGLGYAVPVGSDYEFTPMIDNFQPTPVRYVHKETGEGRTTVSDEELDQFKKVISYGVTSYGYDVRLSDRSDQLKIFSNLHSSEIDPKNITEENFATPIIRTDSQGSKYVLIPPYSYLQGPTVEYFRIPKDILVIVLGKSTYARSALICNSTPVEPEFEGKVTLQITNVTNNHLRVYLEEGIAKLIFSTIGL